MTIPASRRLGLLAITRARHVAGQSEHQPHRLVTGVGGGAEHARAPALDHGDAALAALLGGRVRDASRPRPLSGHGIWVLDMAALLDGRVVAGCMDGRVLVLDPDAPGQSLTPRGQQEGSRQPSRKRYSELGRHGEDWVRAVVALPDGRVVSGRDDGRVLIWDPVAWDPADGGCDPPELGRHQGWVLAVSALPDGRVVSGGKDGQVMIWDPADGGTKLATLGCWVIALATVQLDQAGSYLVVAHQDRGFSVWPVTIPNNR